MIDDSGVAAHRSGLVRQLLVIIGTAVLSVQVVNAAEPESRAAALEFDTEYVPPPGDALVHHTGGYAKVMCSAVFITGLDPEFAAQNIGFFTGPYAAREQVEKPVIDAAEKAVHITIPGGVTRTARYIGDQGCVTLPVGEQSLYFTPSEIESRLSDPATTPWPMGDVLEQKSLPPGLDRHLLEQAVEAAFDPPSGMTAAYLVVWKGQIIAERYGEGITLHTPLESWSMTKTLSATLLGTLIVQGIYDLYQNAPIPEWQGGDDPRADIRISDLLQMASGLRARSPNDPDFDPSGPYPDHLYLYTGGDSAFHYAATRPLQWPPGTVGRYRNTDPVLVNYLIRLGVEGQGGDYHAYPQQALFDRIGIRNLIIETDPYGNFLGQGYSLGSARDWARLGMLYLQDGVWNGERILPEGFVRFATTPAPAWEADGQPVYGGSFWLNRNRALPVPEDAYRMVGVGGQNTLIIPSHDLVVVRLGHYRGVNAGVMAFQRSLELLMQAIPR